MHAWILDRIAGKIRKLIPKGRSACNNFAWELACEFHVVINERRKVQFLKSFYVCLAVHLGGSNTNSFRLLASLFITKNSIDMRILSTELSQLKRIAIINAISNCVCKGFPYRCYILATLANRFEWQQNW